MLTDLQSLATFVESGARLALPVDYAGVSMAMTRPLMARSLRNLDIVCIPTGGLQTDQLIGAGMVRSIETSAVSLGEAGGAPRFNNAVRNGTVRVLDATCPAIHAGLMAAQKGNPFQPIRGLIGTDILRSRPDWRVIQNPFEMRDDPIVVVPAIRPDISIFHAPVADRRGNVWIGRRRELAAMAYASTRTIVTVERIADTDLLADEQTAAGVIPALYVTAVAVAPRGAWPYGLWGEYPNDTAELVRYAAAARTADGFASYMGLPAYEPA